MRTVLMSLMLAACGNPIEQQSFSPPQGTPVALSAAEIDHAARSALSPGEKLIMAHAYPAPGLGESVVQFVAARDDVDLAYVVEATGRRTFAAEFWRAERAAQFTAFGRMTPELFAKVHDEDTPAEIDVEIAIAADLPEPQLPMDGTDIRVATEDFEHWFTQHSNEQQARIAEQKQRVLDVLFTHGGRIIADFRGFRSSERDLAAQRSSAPTCIAAMSSRSRLFRRNEGNSLAMLGAHRCWRVNSLVVRVAEPVMEV